VVAGAASSGMVVVTLSLSPELVGRCGRLWWISGSPTVS
jgi:hypothetical protein